MKLDAVKNCMNNKMVWIATHEGKCPEYKINISICEGCICYLSNKALCTKSHAKAVAIKYCIDNGLKGEVVEALL